MSLLELTEQICSYMKTEVYPDDHEELEEQFLNHLNALRSSVSAWPIGDESTMLFNAEIQFDTLYVLIDGEYGEEEFAFPMEAIRSHNPVDQMRICSMLELISELDRNIIDYEQRAANARESKAKLESRMAILLTGINKPIGE